MALSKKQDKVVDLVLSDCNISVQKENQTHLFSHLTLESSTSPFRSIHNFLPLSLPHQARKEKQEEQGLKNTKKKPLAHFAEGREEKAA